MMSDNRNRHYTGVSTERVAIFIDGSNLYHSLEENCKRFDLDFGAFSRKLTRGRHLFRTYYYNVLRDPERNPQAYQDQQKFLSALYSTPYLEVRLGNAKVRGDTAIEKGVDIMLATDLLQFAWNNLYDVAILVSGDGDFAYAVQAVKNVGKHVEVAAFPANLSWELAHVADHREFFEPEYFSDLWSRSRPRPRNSYQGGYQNSDGYRRPRRSYRPRYEQPDAYDNGATEEGTSTSGNVTEEAEHRPAEPHYNDS